MTTQLPRAPQPVASHPTSPQQVRDSATTRPSRRVEVAWLRRNGDFDLSYFTVPATRIFEDPFTAFAHGTLIQTPRGPVAIEDIFPGDEVDTVEHGPQPVLWRGSTNSTIRPADANRHLTRVMADAFGMARPMRDLLMGPGARLLHRPTGLRDMSRTALGLCEVAALQDGGTVFPVTPPSPVQLYHIALPIHATLNACGLEAESYHPGVSLRGALDDRTLMLFLSLFPHIDQPGDFGPLAYPRLRADASDDITMTAA